RAWRETGPPVRGRRSEAAVTFSAERIGTLLGRPVSESERGTIPTLNDVPEWLIDELRGRIGQIGALRAGCCLEFFVAVAGAAEANSFSHEVVAGRADPGRWGIGDALYLPRVVRASWEGMLAIDAASLRGQ